jgi:endonuclease YncB( thermonuclease family)
MKSYSFGSLFFGLIVTLCFAGNTSASSFFGKVIEINDADVITVFNLNRPVRVKLLGVDAPEKDQFYGDVAKQHLRDLILDKLVSVEYSGIASNGSLVGRVLINGTDVGAQMIRDGVAWYDPTHNIHLTETDRDVYTKSEQAARNERRGLWQADHPVAPWEFVKIEASKNALTVNMEEPPPPVQAPKRARPTTELTSLGLLRMERPTGGLFGSSSNGSSGSSASEASTWEKYQPEGENFSALLPSDGRLLKDSVPFGDQMLPVTFYVAHEAYALYAVMWMTGPSRGETDAAAINGTLHGFLGGIGQGYESAGGKFVCESQHSTDVSLSGYSGREFDMKGCTVPAMARVFTKVTNGQRQMYIGAVFFAKEDPNVRKLKRLRKQQVRNQQLRSQRQRSQQLRKRQLRNPLLRNRVARKTFLASADFKSKSN